MRGHHAARLVDQPTGAEAREHRKRQRAGAARCRAGGAPGRRGAPSASATAFSGGCPGLSARPEGRAAVVAAAASHAGESPPPRIASDQRPSRRRRRSGDAVVVAKAAAGSTMAGGLRSGQSQGWLARRRRARARSFQTLGERGWRAQQRVVLAQDASDGSRSIASPAPLCRSHPPLGTVRVRWRAPLLARGGPAISFLRAVLETPPRAA